MIKGSICHDIHRSKYDILPTIFPKISQNTAKHVLGKTLWSPEYTTKVNATLAPTKENHLTL